jgi:protein MpaA
VSAVPGAAAPAALAPLVIGRSVEGRPIEALARGSGATFTLIHGGIHGDEPDAVRAVHAVAATLAGSTGARIVLVPCANPDGLAAGRKDNARGVDLNRNFPARSFGERPRACDNPGPSPLSEPESAALAALIDVERPARLVAVHQPFRCVNWDGPARDLAERMAAACGWPVVDDIGYPTPGSFGSRYGHDLGVPVITLELPRPATDDDLAAAVAALRVACTP